MAVRTSRVLRRPRTGGSATRSQAAFEASRATEAASSAARAGSSSACATLKFERSNRWRTPAAPLRWGYAAGIAVLLGMAVIFSYVLGWANKAFDVETDPRVEQVMDALPGANCGGCGFIGCYEYAEAVVMKGAPVNKCAPGGANVAAAV